MSFNLKWINKRARNSNYQYIVLRKNFRIIRTLVTIHHLNTIGLFNHNSKHKSCKLVILNMYEIFFVVMAFKHLKIPFWFIKFIKPFLNYIPYTRIPGNIDLLKSLTVYSSKYQCHEFSQKKKWNLFPFYHSRFILRLWLNFLHNKTNLTTNVHLYKKTA